jgi:hypothetical protein
LTEIPSEGGVKGVVSNMTTITECRTAAEVYFALASGKIPNIVEGEFRIEEVYSQRSPRI